MPEHHALFRGLSAFPVTPADEAGRVDAEGLRRLVGRLDAAGVDSVGLLGSTGTYAYLDRAERRRAVEAVAGRTGGRPLIVGVGALRTDEAVALAQDAAGAGAEGLLLAPVSYTPLREAEVFAHFRAVADATRLPICVYNNPSTTHFTVSEALLARLAAVDNIVAVKNPAPPAAEAPARHAAWAAALPADFALGYSGDWVAPASLLAGGVAWYSVVAGFLPEMALRIARAAQRGNAAEVARLDAVMEPLWQLFREVGSLRVAFVAAERLGIAGAVPPRPILPLEGEERARAVAVLRGLGVG